MFFPILLMQFPNLSLLVLKRKGKKERKENRPTTNRTKEKYCLEIFLHLRITNTFTYSLNKKLLRTRPLWNISSHLGPCFQLLIIITYDPPSFELLMNKTFCSCLNPKGKYLASMCNHHWLVYWIILIKYPDKLGKDTTMGDRR